LIVVAKLPGRGRYSHVTVTYTQRLQPGQPTPVQMKKGDPFPINGVPYVVHKVQA
jgi:hypothetical protein